MANFLNSLSNKKIFIYRKNVSQNSFGELIPNPELVAATYANIRQLSAQERVAVGIQTSEAYEIECLLQNSLLQVKQYDYIELAHTSTMPDYLNNAVFGIHSINTRYTPELQYYIKFICLYNSNSDFNPHL